MLERQIDQWERRAVMRNDQRVRQEQEERHRVYAQDQSLPRQPGTYHSLAQADADTPLGRFSVLSNPMVVSQGASYPAAGPHQHDPCGPEPPLGYRVDAMFPDDDEPLAFSSCAQGQLGEPASPLRTGSPLSSDEPMSAGDAPSPVPLADVQRAGIGSSPLNKFRRRI
jgi:hypothetical protein